MSAATQTTTIKASCLYGVRDLRILERQINPPFPTELQISITSTGICGSDQHYYDHYRNGDILVQEPLSLGHESAGVVSAVGSSVTGFKVGDRVALEVGLQCNDCAMCKAGRYNICPEMAYRSSAMRFPHFQGTLQERINHPANKCFKLPDSISSDEGALIEPLSVAIHGVRRAKLEPGTTVLILGAGAVGLLTAAMLRLTGAKKIVICDIEAKRVDFATGNEFADAGFVVPRKRGTTVEEKLTIAKETGELAVKAAGGSGVADTYDAVFECTGVEACVQTSFYAARRGGKAILIGMGTAIQTLPMSIATVREIDIIPVFRYADTYAYAILVLSGEANEAGRNLPDLKKLCTHSFKGLENVPQAFQLAAKGVDEEGGLVLKVMINN